MHCNNKRIWKKKEPIKPWKQNSREFPEGYEYSQLFRSPLSNIKMSMNLNPYQLKVTERATPSSLIPQNSDLKSSCSLSNRLSHFSSQAPGAQQCPLTEYSSLASRRVSDHTQSQHPMSTTNGWLGRSRLANFLHSAGGVVWAKWRGSVIDAGMQLRATEPLAEYRTRELGI